jgi:YfiH family protein
MTLPSDWLVPDWPAPAGVRAVFTSRLGGVSASPYDSFNLGDHVKDDPLAVAVNRERLHVWTGARTVFLHQVHGIDVLKLQQNTPDGVVADACVSDQRGLACTVMVADCLPVLWCHGDGAKVAAAHAGWRGLVGEGGRGVLETTFDTLVAGQSKKEKAQSAKGMLVWLGPCIGSTVFEVGSEVREAFVDRSPGVSDCFQALSLPGKYLADLGALARRQLAALGIDQVYGNDGSQAWCTVTQSSRFFSHRRDAARLGGTGRMAACIWKV